MTQNHHFSIEHVLSHYSLGKLLSCEQNLRGYCNTSFAIQTLDGNIPTWHFLRRYKATIREPEILFEHSLIQHIAQFPDLPVAKLEITKEGKTYLIEPCQDSTCSPTFFAIFDYLPGEDRYTWVNPHCSEVELRQAAALLARYHRAVWDFQPQGKREEPDLRGLLPIISANLQACLERPLPAEFQKPIGDYLSFLQNKIAQLQHVFSDPKTAHLPRVIIHHDYHPGNLRFVGDEIVGLFDFDWAKRDCRILDVALALFYFATEWQGEADGQLRMNEVKIFLDTYQHTMLAQPQGQALSKLEEEMVWQFIEAANLYVLNWTILDILNKEVDIPEYAVYLWHGLNTAVWLDENKPLK
ncbi:MAG: hypothetical protein DDG59_02205 [Anaerolineae bacterium]|jgi:homoserine kinase type II|nr:MAG: hypothetical protein DDG59_02205 [Anaerolineae bacterium]